MIKSKAIHGDRYDYSQTNYYNCRTKVTIICSKHGQFKQLPSNHVKGMGCIKCGRDLLSTNNSLSTEEFVNRVNIIHNYKYDYPDLCYKNNNTKIKINCRLHGLFLQSPAKHLVGQGCPKCGIRHNTQDFITKIKNVHGDRYDYSKTEYVDSCSKVIIICQEHGEFLQRPANHLKGQGCPKCPVDYSSMRCDTKGFIGKAILIHGDRYDYSKTEYINSRSNIVVICPKHGGFFVKPTHHLSYGVGCRRCACMSSGLEQKISNFLNIDFITNDRLVLDGHEIDIYIPSRKIGIEVNGIYYHSSKFKSNKYHQNKFKRACNNGVKLFQFWEHEINSQFELVMSMINNSIGMSSKIHARKCQLKTVDSSDIEEFCDINHIQGYRSASVNYVLVYQSEIVYAASFSRHNVHEWEIIRTCSKRGFTVNGGFSKILSTFKKEYNPTNIMTFADARYSCGWQYYKNGFVPICLTNPNYFYYKNGGSVILSRMKCQKHKLRKLLGDNFDPMVTEKQNMISAGYKQIYDAGSIKLIWTAEPE